MDSKEIPFFSHVTPDRILAALKSAGGKGEILELKRLLPQYKVPDEDWYIILKDMINDGLIYAKLVETGIDKVIRGIYGIELTSRGRMLAPEMPLQSTEEESTLKSTVVTLSGECLRVEFQRKVLSHDRDGDKYRFHVTDESSKQEKRLISFFWSGSAPLGVYPTEEQVVLVCINVLRRKFDSGQFSFSTSYDQNEYREFTLDAVDFQPSPAVDWNTLKNYIVNKAYWIGFRHNIDPRFPIQFDTVQDLSYLGVPNKEVHRIVWSLGNSGMLEKVMEGMARPTAKLIDDFEAQQSAHEVKATITESLKAINKPHEWDVFISHAYEDKREIATPLYEELVSRGLRVWYDQTILTLGDSLRQVIDRGLSQSKYGVVILSKHFFEKHWPAQELDGLATREVNGQKVILPIWHDVTRDDVMQYSTILAGRFAARSDEGIRSVADKILQVCRHTDSQTSQAKYEDEQKLAPAAESPGQSTRRVHGWRPKARIEVSYDAGQVRNELLIKSLREFALTEVNLLTLAGARVAGIPIGGSSDSLRSTGFRVHIPHDQILKLTNPDRDFAHTGSTHGKLSYSADLDGVEEEFELPVRAVSDIRDNTLWVKLEG